MSDKGPYRKPSIEQEPVEQLLAVAHGQCNALLTKPFAGMD